MKDGPRTLLDLEVVPEFPLEPLLQRYGAVQLAQRSLGQIVHLPFRVAVQDGPQRLLDVEVQQRLSASR